MGNMERGKAAMRTDFAVLVDSDGFVGRFYPNDAHYQRARDIFQSLRDQQLRLVTTSFVVAETATVLSHRQGQELARKFLEDFIGAGDFDVIHITEELQDAARQLFIQQTTKGTSMTDCANVVVMKNFAIPRIFSFDKVYAKHFHLQVAA